MPFNNFISQNDGGENLEINKLRAFVNLAQTLNFSKTAENLYTSQSAISKQIKSLERELGHNLFRRTNKNVEISAFGKSILTDATAIVELNKRVVNLAKNFDVEKSNQITLGVIPSFSNNDIFRKVIDYQTLHPTVKVIIHEDETCNLLNLLDEGKIDVAYTRSLDPTGLNYDQVIVTREEFVACLNKKHPLATAHRINLHQLKDEKFIMLSQQSLLYQPVVDLCHAVGFEPQVSFTSERVSSIFQMVKENQGVAIMMQPDRPRQDIVTCPLVPTRASYLLFAKSRQSNAKPVTDFWNYLQQFAMPKWNN
jgi:LysR family transcriptional activator of glutamate synthase operon